MKKLIKTLMLVLICNLGIFSQPVPMRTIDGQDAGLVLQRVPEVWAEGYYGQGVLIASIDEDFNWDHPDIVNNIWNNLGEDVNGNGVTIIWNGERWVYDPGDLNDLDDDGNGYIDDLIGWNFVNNNNILTRNDATSHGTQVAGVLVGDGTNGIQTGIAPQAQLMLLRIGTNSEQEQYYAWEAMQYCIDMGVDIISQSQSFHWDDTWCDENGQNCGPPDVAKFREMAELELEAGIIHFSSISNDGNIIGIPFNISVPGNLPPPWLHPEQVIVGGLTAIMGIGNVDAYQPNEIHITSPYGPSSQEDYSWFWNDAHPMPIEYQDYPYYNGNMGLLKPDITAYGANTESINGTYPNFIYDSFGGTSSASPHAAGVAALLLSVDPNLTPADICRILKLTSIDNGPPGYDNRYGAGTIDAYEAYLEVLNNFSITVNSPNGGESWQAGSQQTITWNDNISEDVKIELFQAGNYDSEIDASTSSDGSYSWDIPSDSTPSTDYTVKIASINNETIADVSDATFNITATSSAQTKFAVIGDYGYEGPNTAAVANLINSWNVDFIITVGDNSYDPAPIDDNIGQYYSDWIGNYNGTYGSGSPINKFFPSIGNHEYSDGGGINAYLNYFTLPGISGNSSGNERYYDYVIDNIHFFVINSDNHEPDGNNSVSTQASWLENAMTNSTAKWKIVYFHHPPYSSSSNHGSSNNMRWDFLQWGADAVLSAHDHTYERLEADGLTYFVNGLGGKSIYNFGTPLSESQFRYNGDYGAMLMEATESTLTAKFYNTSGTLIDSWSKDNTIASVNVTVPNGGESWARGLDHVINWDDNFIQDVKIDLYKAGVFHSAIEAATPSDGTRHWVIPGSTPVGSDYKIKISNVSVGAVFDYSDGDFTIGSFEITVPNGGESWEAGTLHQFQWNDVISDNEAVADFELWKGGVFDRVLFVNQNADGSKNWDIPIDLTTGSDYRIKIIHSNDPTDFDYSDADFNISASTISITVTAPNGGESWQAGTTQIITWDDNITENVKIELYKGGTPNSTIITSTTSDGSYSWNIPAGTTVASDYTVVITSVNTGTLTDVSNANFSITAAPFITVNSPNGGESWQAGTTQTITWDDNITENVKIDLYKNGAFNSPIIASTTSDGSYNWDIPAGTTVASDYTVVITSVNTGTLTDVSNANFSITATPFITVNSPNGGESWQVGTQHTITWNDNIAENVKINLYKNDDFNSTLVASTPNDGSYSWDIPAGTTPDIDYKVKIRSTTDASLFDYSDANFSITTASFITVTAPNGGESWQAGTQHTITWNDDIDENVKIELYKGGTPNSTIITSTTSDGSYSWNIPAGTTVASDYTVVITSVNTGTLTDVSNANFSITAAPFITVNSPNGGESWQADTQHTITWNDNIDENVKIELYKGGTPNSTIITSTTSDGSYSWNIPAGTTVASDYTVVITSVNTGTLTDVSNANFSITATPFITVNSPNGGESWQAGTQHTITWNDNIDENVKIELYKGGTPNSTIITSTTSDGSYSWNIPAGTTVASDYTIKITSLDNGAISDVSNANFSITAAPFITVNSPNGGESWQAGTQHTITWNDNIDENVKIELYKGGTPNSTIITSTTSDGSYSWNIPAGTTVASDYTIKITSLDNGAISDVSNANFSITAAPFITVNSPNGGESWQAGTQHTITWNDNIDENVKIELYKGGTPNSTIITSTTSDGSYSWNIPAGTTPASDYTIKITSLDNGTISDVSDAVFDVTAASFITVSVPNGGESWQAGTTQTITWDDNITENVKIDLYKNGAFNSPIIASTTSDGSYSWNIPAGTTVASDYTIKITSLDNGAISDVSDAVFNVTAASFITVSVPNGGESWQAGTTQTITWDDNITENVKIDLYKNGAFNSPIIASTTSDGSYSWNISSGTTPASDYTIKITSLDNGTISDVSDAVFDVTAASFITVSVPNGGESWQAGTTQTITWDDNITENVKIDLYKNGAFNSPIIASTTSDGSYSWNISSGTTPASDYTIKITSLDNGTISDVSDAVFDVTAASFITVSVPNGGESWQAGTTQTITWDDNITENVKIDLYKNGAFNSPIIASTTSDGSYSWNISSGTTPASDYTIKITSLDNGTISDVSDAVFDVTAASFITVSVPNGGESWQAGTTQTITWDDNITENVKIDLYKNGAFNSPIIASTTSDGSYNWNISSGTTPASDYTIKITSLDNGTISDVSDAVFDVTAASFITVSVPNGGESWQAGTTQTITWDDNITENVKIDLYKNGAFNSPIIASTTSDGSYNWNISSGTTPASDYTVVITSVNTGTLTDVSNANFSITAAPFITVNSPNGGESWQAGTTQIITWDDNIAEDVKINLYKNDDFNSTLVGSTPNDGSYSWNVPAGTTPDIDYKVKIRSTTDASLFDYSDNNFTITESTIIVDFTVNLVVYDDCSNSSTLIFGTAPDATDCYDPFHDLYAPPTAPSFAYDSRFNSCGEDLIKDIRATNLDSIFIWDVYYHPETGCNPISLNWNPNELPTNGNFYLVDPFGGSLVNINMRQDSIYSDTFEYNHLQILFNNSSELSIDISEGWNTISLPLEVEDNYYKTLFPNALNRTLFGYDGSYYSSDSIKVEKGYWLRFDDSGFVNIEGIEILQMDLDLTSGWNFIGGPACDIVYNSIADPGGIIIPGTLFGFNGSYFNADTLLRGKGYWIRTNASGIITLDCSAAPNLPKVGKSEFLLVDLTEFIKVELEDNKGNHQTLYFGGALEDNVNIESYSLPPIPPTRIFDSRISGGYRLSESEEIGIMIQSDDYPLKVKLTGTNYGNAKGYLLKEFAGNVEVGDREISDGIAVIINNENVSLLKVQLNSRLPVNFVLEQNYPNPFNPSTKIKYRVPVRGNINLKVINSLGQEIATLVNEEKAAGIYEEHFDSSNLASGIYFYRIKLISTSTNTAEGQVGQVIVETRKMVLLR